MIMASETCYFSTHKLAKIGGINYYKCNRQAAHVWPLGLNTKLSIYLTFSKALSYLVYFVLVGSTSLEIFDVDISMKRGGGLLQVNERGNCGLLKSEAGLQMFPTHT